MITRLSLLLAVLALFAAVLAGDPASAAGPQVPAAVQSYTGCLSPILNAIYDVAPGDTPAHACARPAAAIHLSSGDVTALAAGTGLAGGGDNGDLSLSIAPGYRLPQACSNGQLPAWSGSAWACASGASQADFNAFVALLASAGTINTDSNPVHWTRLKGVPAGFADGTDDVGPSYAAGAGLNLAGTTFSVDPAQVQDRIADSCPAGSSIRAIAQDGSVTCEGHSSYTAGEGLALSGSQFSVADGGVTQTKLSFDPTTQAEFNAFTGLLGSAGTINDSTNPVDWSQLKGVPAGLADGVDNADVGDLRGYCAQVQASPSSFPDAPCRARFAEVDTLGDAGQYPSIAIGTDGNPVISYYDGATHTALMVAHCNDPSCAAGNQAVSAVDDTFGVGQYSSLAIGTDGNPVISYYDAQHGNLKVARCNDPACTGGNETLSTVDTAGNVGRDSSLAIGTDGNPVISYYDQTNGALKVAKCNDPSCSGGNESLRTVDSGLVGAATSLAIGEDGNPVISYQDYGPGALKVAKCDDPACIGGGEVRSTVDVDPGSFLASSTSLAIGIDGNPVISYFDATHGYLKVAKCNDPACFGGDESISTADSAGGVGASTSIAIGIDGNPVISYYDLGHEDLKVASCNDAACGGGDEAVSTVDSAGIVGFYTSLAIGTDGNPVIAYYDYGNQDLKLARPAITTG